MFARFRFLTGLNAIYLSKCINFSNCLLEFPSTIIERLLSSLEISIACQHFPALELIFPHPM
ncbi:318_t:CDS:2 [Dentiscutata erythropus]|uniref:318_t:CDS:1 n=1 Tax=Dentiscutata erythropus TaxID=1348616 RepID=A0A9N9G7Z2_9GLOM|nr:318_t:CDS:2 [Dentiscutata erythropus]